MTKNQNTDVLTGPENTYAAWGLGFNIREKKMDDLGLLRPASCVDHGGWAGTKLVIDPEEQITAAIFTAEYKQGEVGFPNNIYGRVMNVIYSALE